MIFALLFILAFLLGLLVYLVSRRWVAAVAVPSAVYLTIILLDAGIGADSAMSLVFGLPITFCGGLLGSYVVELRRGLVEEGLSADMAEGSQTPRAEGSQTPTAEGSTLASERKEGLND